MIVRDYHTGRLTRLWRDELLALDKPPFPIGPDSCLVAYYASAELGCFLSLGWPMPARILDLCAEFRCHTCGLTLPVGEDKKRHSLLCALTYHGLDGLSSVEKSAMQQLAQREGEHSPAERSALLDYCQSDVDALARLLPVMLPHIDMPRALLRGPCMGAAARMEHTGVPIDTEALATLRGSWARIKGELIATVDIDYGVFVPTGQRTLNPETRYGAAILDEATRTSWTRTAWPMLLTRFGAKSGRSTWNCSRRDKPHAVSPG